MFELWVLLRNLAAKTCNRTVERILEKRLQDTVNLSELQYECMPGKEMVDAFFVLKRMEEEYRENRKSLYECFVDLQKAFEKKSCGVGNDKERNARGDDKRGDEFV